MQDPFDSDCGVAFAPGQDEPTRAALAAIDAEWPLIAAEVDLVDAECRVIANPADVLALRAQRRAVRALLALRVQRANHDGPVPAAAIGVNPINLHSADHRPEAA